MEEWFEDLSLQIILKLAFAREKQTMELIKQLENELHTENRFFPRNKITDKIEKLVDAPHKKLSRGSVIYRARTIDKYQEEKIFGQFLKDTYGLIKELVPNFNEYGSDFEWIKVSNYIKTHDEAKLLLDRQFERLYDKYGKKGWWGYDEENSDAPPKGKAGNGRINPQGISYLYSSNNIKTAALEVRPVISQYLSIAEIEVKNELNLFDFTTNYDYETSQKYFDQSVDLTVFGEYFSQPNYSGASSYYATQYISEYIKQIKDQEGKNIFDGLCFRSSLNNDGLNYVLFDVSETKKYSVINSSVYQFMDLLGNLQKQLPLEHDSKNYL